MVAQVHRAIAWVYLNIERWDGDYDRIYLSGHSSGAHLAATALIQGWTAEGLPDRMIKGAHFVSGPYDLQPVLLSARSSYVKLTKAEENELSPLRHVSRIKCPVFIGYAENDTDEFQRQSREFAAALNEVGRLNGSQRFSGLNHFEIMEAFGDADSLLAKAIRKSMS
jgi:arylformamidase